MFWGCSFYTSQAVEILETIEVAAAVLHRCSDGVVEIRMNQGSRVGVDEISEVLDAQLLLTPGVAAVLVDARGTVSMTREAQEATANNTVNDRTAGTAILVDSPVSSLLGNFFIRFARPPYPTRLFRKEEPAREWILELLAKFPSG